MDELLVGSVENLLGTYLEDQGLFPYSSTVVDGRFINVYDEAAALRYTINSLLGLAEAARYGVGGLPSDDVRAMTERFLTVSGARVENLADIGLLTFHLALNGDDTGRLAVCVKRGKTPSAPALDTA